MDTRLFTAMSDELLKIAMAISDVQPQPGDILLSKRSVKKYPFWGRVTKALGAVQGSDIQHAAIYVGDGKVVEGVIGKGIVEEYLYRVKATLDERKAAAEYAKNQLGKGYSYKDFIYAAAPSLVNKKTDTLTLKDKQDFICSGLVAASYPGKYFRGRAASTVRPVDLKRSWLTKRIAVLPNTEE
jgi:uncharacterized protein YycO